MLTFIKNLFIAIIAIGISSFLILSSIVFGESQIVGTHEYIQGHEVKAYVIQESTNDDKTKSLTYTSIPKGQVPQFDKNSALYIDFGRLASAFLLPGENMNPENIFSMSGNNVTLSESSPMIISLYDPFSTYSILSAKGNYSINQITNGSFYIGNEDDSTISVYSIDAVVKLNFLYEGGHMADIVLFPGMYVRFDPALNRYFKDVTDPFRVAQVIGSDNTMNSTKGTTGIEFINPRMESTESTDTFFVYRLPISTRLLFRMLHTMFHDKVAQIDIMKSYASEAGSFSDATSNSWLINPSKVNHFLLLELKGTLSQGLQSQTNIESFKKKIQAIRERAKDLEIGNSVNQTFEQFLTDGRFALFGSMVSSKYEKIYSEVASIVGIAPSTGKAKLFQKLADIYSHNLVTQKKDLTFSKIDTYSPTSVELDATLGSSDIDHKDYFDIALYAFSILEKAKDRQLFESQAMTAHATYQLLSTLFTSTSKYASSVQDVTQRAKNYRSIALHFYDPILRTFTRSMYYYFTNIESGRIFLNEKALTSEGKIKLSRDLVRDIKNVDSVIRGIVAELQGSYIGEKDLSTFLNIRRSSLRIHAFANILQDEAYNNYILSPYMAINDGDVNLPQISDDEKSVVTYSAQQTTEVPVDTTSVNTQLSPDTTMMDSQQGITQPQ